jgi:hypothetical protein
MAKLFSDYLNEMASSNKLSTKEDIAKAIASFDSLPKAKMPSEAKSILKAAEKVGYAIKAEKILKYADKSTKELEVDSEKDTLNKHDYDYIDGINTGSFGWEQATSTAYHKINKDKYLKDMYAKLDDLYDETKDYLYSLDTPSADKLFKTISKSGFEVGSHFELVKTDSKLKKLFDEIKNNRNDINKYIKSKK